MPRESTLAPQEPVRVAAQPQARRKQVPGPHESLSDAQHDSAAAAANNARDVVVRRWVTGKKHALKDMWSNAQGFSGGQIPDGSMSPGQAFQDIQRQRGLTEDDGHTLEGDAQLNMLRKERPSEAPQSSWPDLPYDTTDTDPKGFGTGLFPEGVEGTDIAPLPEDEPENLTLSEDEVAPQGGEGPGFTMTGESAPEQEPEEPMTDKDWAQHKKDWVKQEKKRVMGKKQGTWNPLWNLIGARIAKQNYYPRMAESIPTDEKTGQRVARDEREAMILKKNRRDRKQRQSDIKHLKRFSKITNNKATRGIRKGWDRLTKNKRWQESQRYKTMKQQRSGGTSERVD